MSAWISVKERLPPKYVPVLVHDGVNTQTVAYFNSSKTRWFVETNGDELSGITHWQPLPEPSEDK